MRQLGLDAKYLGPVIDEEGVEYRHQLNNVTEGDIHANALGRYYRSPAMELGFAFLRSSHRAAEALDVPRSKICRYPMENPHAGALYASFSFQAFALRWETVMAAEARL